MKRVTAVVLAAGFSSRFGADKRLAKIQSQTTLLESVIRQISPLFEDILLVVRSGEQAQYQFAGVRTLEAPSAPIGMGESLSAAAHNIDDPVAVAVFLGDMPCIDSRAISQLLCAVEDDAIVVPIYQSKRGHPVCFGGRYVEELKGLSGDQGARSILNAFSRYVVEVPVDDDGVLLDIDTKSDLLRLKNRNKVFARSSKTH